MCISDDPICPAPGAIQAPVFTASPRVSVPTAWVQTEKNTILQKVCVYLLPEQGSLTPPCRGPGAAAQVLALFPAPF